MNTEGFKRKLSAILSADVAGYSRLMGEDDDTTVRTLTGHREMMSILIKRHQGRVVDSPGDNLLAEFESVLQGVNCAVEIQRELAERNAELSENRKMEFRIGVNVGDVIKEGERIYGDGVNIAARLESLAEPGGICISGFVYHQVKNRLKLEYEYLGEQSVKNIKEPVPVYRVLSFPGAAAHRVIEAKKAAEKAVIGSSFSDKPSIAVLPFVNLSNDPEQEYFSDGMSEEIIGALAKLEGLKVISRTSAFHFKGKDVDLRTVGEKLKVDNVLEGSVRKAGNKLRISAQLIKVDDDTHIWSESYDRELEDVFAIQDEISQAVVQSLKVKLLGMEGESLVKDYTKNTEAYELFLKGRYFFENKSDYEKAIEYMRKAIEADPDYVPAYAIMAYIIGVKAFNGLLSPREAKRERELLIKRAIEIDDKYGFTYVQLGMHKIIDGYDWNGAERDFKRALELNPGDSSSHSHYSIYLAVVGRIDEAIEEAKRTVEFDPLSISDRYHLAWFLTFDGQLERAIEISQETLELDPNSEGVSYVLALAYSGKEMHEKAISILRGLRNIPIFQAHLGYLYGKAGKIKEAQKILDELHQRSKREYISAYMIAIVYSGIGEKDKVFEWLDKAYEERDVTQVFLKVYPTFINLHSDPRWTEQLKKRGLAD